LPVAEGPVELSGVEAAGLLAAGELGCTEGDVLDVLLDAGFVDEEGLDGAAAFASEELDWGGGEEVLFVDSYDVAGVAGDKVEPVGTLP